MTWRRNPIRRSGQRGPPDAVAACARPTDTTRVGRRAPADGLFGGPTVGPLSFYVSDYADGYLTKVVIHPQKQPSEPITLTGSRCRDGLPLLFWFEDGVPPGPTAGDDYAILEPVGAGVSYTGYMLFTAQGRWQVTATQGGAELGVLLVEVA
ncbi:MAG TPA: hypothetical protein VFC19_39450 [Candidatus Limnocylindrales bacterium]|nr:hypothetical protein [Candidatus Limnocylindrales bacterium]